MSRFQAGRARRTDRQLDPLLALLSALSVCRRPRSGDARAHLGRRGREILDRTASLTSCTLTQPVIPTTGESTITLKRFHRQRDCTEPKESLVHPRPPLLRRDFSTTALTGTMEPEQLTRASRAADEQQQQQPAPVVVRAYAGGQTAGGGAFDGDGDDDDEPADDVVCVGDTIETDDQQGFLR